MEIFWNTIASYNAADMARTDPTDAGCGHTDAAALPSPDARGTHRHEDLYGAAQFLDRRCLLPLIRRTTRAQRHAGALLGDHGVHLGIRPGCETRFAPTHAQPYRLRAAAVRHAARLPALFAGAGAYVPDGHHARDAVFGRRIHHRADAGLFRSGSTSCWPCSSATGR